MSTFYRTNKTISLIIFELKTSSGSIAELNGQMNIFKSSIKTFEDEKTTLNQRLDNLQREKFNLKNVEFDFLKFKIDSLSQENNRLLNSNLKCIEETMNLKQSFKETDELRRQNQFLQCKIDHLENNLLSDSRPKTHTVGEKHSFQIVPTSSNSYENAAKTVKIKSQTFVCKYFSKQTHDYLILSKSENQSFYKLRKENYFHLKNIQTLLTNQEQDPSCKIKKPCVYCGQMYHYPNIHISRVHKCEICTKSSTNCTCTKKKL